MQYPTIRRAALEILIDANGPTSTNEAEADAIVREFIKNEDPARLIAVESELAALSEADFDAVCSGERIGDNEFRNEEGKTVTISADTSEFLDIMSL